MSWYTDPYRPFNWANYCRRRRRRWYKDKNVGARKPATWLRRPSKAEMYAAARRFARDGETANAVEMFRLAEYPLQLNITLQPGRDQEVAQHG